MRSEPSRRVYHEISESNARCFDLSGCHADRRAALCEVRCPFDIDIVSKGKIFIDAKSILGVLSLDVEEPLELKYDGYDEDFESVIAGLAC